MEFLPDMNPPRQLTSKTMKRISSDFHPKTDFFKYSVSNQTLDYANYCTQLNLINFIKKKKIVNIVS